MIIHNWITQLKYTNWNNPRNYKTYHEFDENGYYFHNIEKQTDVILKICLVKTRRGTAFISVNCIHKFEDGTFFIMHENVDDSLSKMAQAEPTAIIWDFGTSWW